jgi:hypothetical protein
LYSVLSDRTLSGPSQMGCGAACERNYPSQPRHYPTALLFDLHFLPTHLFQTVDLALYKSSEQDNILTRDITASDTEASQPPHRVLAQSTSNSNRSVRTILCEMEPNQAISHAYTPFSQPTEIRVAIIEPSIDREAPLQFSFHQARLEELEGRYEAVSYVWGAPILTFPVHHIADGSQIFVTENLDHVLRSQRQALDTCWLWADAMCIDQRNYREKEVQIPLMIDIYRGAKRVLAWLHQGDEAVERGIRCIDRISRNPITPQTVFQEHGSHCSKLLDILKLANLTYFRRLWIVQEVVFNLDVTFICGKSELSWVRLAKGLNHIQSWSNSKEGRTLGHEVDILYQIADLWKINAIGLDPNLGPSADHEHILNLVVKFRTHMCTDDRDRIYAVHALAHQNNAHMPIDYSWDVYETYRRFALACMADGWTADILRTALAGLDTHSGTNWPSWMPDWRCLPDRLEKFRYADYESMVKYIRNVNDNTVELEANFLASLGHDDAVTRHFTVHTEDIVCMANSLSDFLSATISLYRKGFTSSEPNSVHSWLALTDLWEYAGLYFSHSDLIRLLAYIKLLWETPTTCTEEMKEYEESLKGPIVASTEGFCFYAARYTGSKQSWFCYGRSNVMGGDILLITSKGMGQLAYYTCILRPVKEYVEDNSLKSHPETGPTLSGLVYRLIGSGWAKGDYSVDSHIASNDSIYVNKHSWRQTYAFFKPSESFAV